MAKDTSNPMHELLTQIAHAYQNQQDEIAASGWHITRVTNGMNGIVYHAQADDGRDFAVKISKRDDRDRAGREFKALTALRELDVAPQPIALVHEPQDLPGDVTISTWLQGTMLENHPPPEAKARWQMLLESISTPHRIQPNDQLSNAVMYVREPGDLLDLIDGWYKRLPPEPLGTLSAEERTTLLRAVHQQTRRTWDKPAPIGLIHCDSNPNNLIEAGHKIRLVDWENSGWADPAFDLADLCAQPNYGVTLPDEHHVWLRTEHARLLNDKMLPERAECYQRLLLAWWVMRMSAYWIETNTTRLPGVVRIDENTMLERQAMMYTKARAAFGV